MKYLWLAVLMALVAILIGARENNLAKGSPTSVAAVSPSIAGYKWGDPEGSEETKAPKRVRAEESGPPCVATYARFKRLKQGYREGFVKSLMKCEGTMMSAQRIGNYNYRTFRWDGEQPGSFMTVTYSDYLVNSVTQYGLQ